MTCVRLRMPVGALVAAALMLVAGWHTAASAQSTSYRFDKDHTAVSFSWSHVGLSRQSARVMEIDGRIEFDPVVPDASKIEVVMQADSIWTGNATFDEHLKSSDYFNVVKHPLIQFRSTGIRRKSDRTGEVVGDLTIMGITRPVTLDVILNFHGQHPLATINPNYRGLLVAGFSATGVLRRSDWNLSLGVPLVSDEIRFSIETELLQQ